MNARRRALTPLLLGSVVVASILLRYYCTLSTDRNSGVRVQSDYLKKAATGFPPADSKAREDFGPLMSARRKALREACRKIQGGSAGRRPSPDFKRLAALTDGRDVYYCPVFKAASTSWLTYMMMSSPRLSQEKKEELSKAHQMTRLRDVSQPMKSYADLDNYVRKRSPGSFLVVRHPFSRLVSAFKNKLESGRDRWFQRKTGAPIVKKYRSAAVERFGEEFFSESNNFGAPVKVEGRTAEQPCFWEFVRFVLDTPPSRHNHHWSSISVDCRPCHIHYDNILHFENMAEEQAIMTTLLDPANKTEKEATAMYFDQLSGDEIAGLKIMYRDDMMLFGYDSTEEDLTKGI